MSFTIIKNAGPPPVKSGGRPLIYPIPDLDIGDAFDVPHDGEQERVRKTVSACARNHAKRNPGKKFTSRVIGDVVRVYRVA